MKSFYTLAVDGQEYKLRLTASAIMSIEKRLGKSMLVALENYEENMIETLITILWGAMKPLNTDFSFEKAVELFDNYIDNGQSVVNFMEEINSLLETSGFFNAGQE